MDRVTVFGQKAKPLMLAPRVPLILIESGHNDSDQDFTTIEMMFIRGDRFQWIGDFTTLDEEVCDYKRLEPWYVSALPDVGPYPALHVSVVERVTLTGGNGCGDRTAPRPRVTSYQANYRWDARAQRFLTPSTEMHRLQEMGLTVGTTFRVVKVAPFGDPVEIDLRGYRLCLRKRETEAFEVEPVV